MTPLLNGGAYEPEIAFIVTRIMRSNGAFIDCGANIGWWSLFASTMLPRQDQILAIEAAPSMFARLTETASLNHDRFLCLNAAVWDQTGQPVTVSFHEVLHSAATVKEPSGHGFHLEDTTSIRIDDAAERYLRRAGGPTVLKLDVEGAEVEAMEGAQRLLDEWTLIIYEDHGKDTRATVTKAMFDLGYDIFFCDEQFRLHQMTNIERIQAVKRDPRRGYNFFACRPGSPLHRQLLSLIPAPSSRA
jgi:FkbM family methyltransferase